MGGDKMVGANDYLDKISKINLTEAGTNTKWGFFYSIDMSARINNQIVLVQEQNNKIIEQNDEIINLLKEIRDK